MSDQVILINEEAAGGEPNRTASGEPSRTIDPILMEEMVKAGILYGRKKSKTHPLMKKNITAIRNGIAILDLAQTIAAVDKAGEFLKEIARKGGLILAVGTQPAAQQLVEEFSKNHGLSYVIKRWLGGTLTNFKTISQRIQYFTNLKADRAAGKLEKYTKKEQVEFNKQISKLNDFFVGMENLSRLPDALLIVDINEHLTAVREANRLKIPILGILSSDANPDLVSYPIPANDNSRSSISWILNKLGAKIEEGIREKSEAPNLKS